MRVEQFIRHLESHGWKQVPVGKIASTKWRGRWQKKTNPDYGTECTLICEIRKHRGKWFVGCTIKGLRRSNYFTHQISELIFMNGWNRFNRSENFIGKLEYTGFFEEK